MKLQLTVFLLRKDVHPLVAVSEASLEHAKFFLVSDGKLDPIGPEEPEIFGAAAGGDVVVALFQRPVGTPPWQRFVADEFTLPTFGSPGQSLGAIVFCATEESRTDSMRWLAWCFGSGSRYIRRPATEPRFGLLVVLNTLAVAIAEGQVRGGRGPQLRTLQYRTTTPYFQQTGHRAARDIPVDAFRFDRQSDLVSTVGGDTGDPSVPVVVGGRSCGFRTDVGSVQDLVDLASELLKRAHGDEYKTGYGWIDNITPVSEEATIAALRATLAGLLLQDPVPGNVDVLLPDDYPEFDERAIEYVLLPRETKRRASRITITADVVGQLARSHNESGDDILDLELRFLDSSREGVASASVLECLCADLELDGQQYIAYDGDFYVVDHTFVEGVNAEVDAIEPCGLPLPSHPGGGEPKYFDHVKEQAKDDFVVVDRALLRQASERGGIEAADLVASSGALVHVKRKGKSAVLSHLFFQAGNSCDLLRQADDARDQLVAVLEGSDGDPAVVSSASAAVQNLGDQGVEGEVVFAIIGDWRDRSAKSLPLFSKISLVQAARRVRQLRFRPTIALVGLTSTT